MENLQKRKLKIQKTVAVGVMFACLMNAAFYITHGETSKMTNVIETNEKYSPVAMFFGANPEQVKKQQQLQEIQKQVDVQKEKELAKKNFVEGKHSDIKEILWKVSEENNLPVYYVYGVAMVETGESLNPKVVGPSTPFGKAKGLMQLIDSTAKMVGVDDVFDPYQNASGGAKYLSQLIKQYQSRTVKDNNGNEVSPEKLAIIAYNWGPTNLDDHIKYHGCLVPTKMPEETQNYLTKMNKYYKM